MSGIRVGQSRWKVCWENVGLSGGGPICLVKLGNKTHPSLDHYTHSHHSHSCCGKYAVLKIPFFSFAWSVNVVCWWRLNQLYTVDFSIPWELFVYFPSGLLRRSFLLICLFRKGKYIHDCDISDLTNGISVIIQEVSLFVCKRGNWRTGCGLWKALSW